MYITSDAGNHSLSKGDCDENKGHGPEIIEKNLKL